MLSFEVACAAHDWPTQRSVFRRRSKYSCIFGAENSAPQCLALMIEVCYRFLLKSFINGFPLQQIVFVYRKSDLKKRLISLSPDIRTLSRNNFFSPRTIWVDFYPAIKCPSLFQNPQNLACTRILPGYPM